MAEEDGQFLRMQAERCRWLASQSSDPKVVSSLRNMARAYEAKAAQLENGQTPQ
jgi:hypothetical protein